MSWQSKLGKAAGKLAKGDPKGAAKVVLKAAWKNATR